MFKIFWIWIDTLFKVSIYAYWLKHELDFLSIIDHGMIAMVVFRTPFKGNWPLSVRYKNKIGKLFMATNFGHLLLYATI